MSQSQLLPATTQMGAITLWVADLDAMVRYYQSGVGLSLLSQGIDYAVLGFNNQPIIILEAKKEMRHASAHEAGLFHTAILFSSEESLARAVQSVASKYPGTFTGSADHLVSKAFYFNDPEGNGVELYWDRERSSWSWVDGRITMDTLYLDPNQFLSDHLKTDSASEIPENLTLGHVHLSVGSIAAAEEFYIKMLGFEKTLNWGDSALFVSAGGYHHHMAMNTWRSKGAGRRQLTLGLAQVKIELEDGEQVDETKDRLDFYNLATTNLDGKIKIEDPWGNSIYILSKS
jgi:catechol 2,3-dioxygenase